MSPEDDMDRENPEGPEAPETPEAAATPEPKPAAKKRRIVKRRAASKAVAKDEPTVAEEGQSGAEKPAAAKASGEKKATAKKPVATKPAAAKVPSAKQPAAEAASGPESKPQPPAAKPSKQAPRRRVVRAHARYVRTSARKARMVCGHLRGKSVPQARAILAFTPREVARDWSKLLESAVANAESNHELLGDDLVVREAYADEGPTIKRVRPRAMGRATPIRKRTSHLTITLIAGSTDQAASAKSRTSKKRS
jgi:ribosomal protein L22